MKDQLEDKISEIMNELSLDEKIGMIHGNGLFQNKGVERLGIEALKFSDGPMGVRNEFENTKWIPSGNTDDYVSYLPSNSAVASTWNLDIAYQIGQVLGEEARGRGKDVILAPGINIKRSPLCGRNFEYLSEDPLLTASMTVPIIKGIQENDVAACVKHFAANSQETNRLHLDTKVDERTLQEVYYPAFKAAVQEAEVYSIMGAYNKVNGCYSCENKTLLETVLQKEWGYDGTVISDWGAVHGTKEAAEAPLDIEMSVFDNFNDYCMAEPLKKAILAGEIDERYVDKKVNNILRMMFRLKMIGEENTNRKGGAYNTPGHREILKKAAEEAIILLKNEERVLPLKKEALFGKKIAVIGRNGTCIHSDGGGSAEIKALYEMSPLMGIKMQLGGNTQVTFAKGYYIPPKQEQSGENWQANSIYDKETIQKQIKAMREEKKRLKKELFHMPACEEAIRLQEEALKLAGESDEVIFVGGLNHDFDIEGEDRPYMRLPYLQDELIEKLLEINPKTILVMMSGAPVEMHWVDKAKAVIWAYYSGMETGTALAEIIFGEKNPSAKLAETIPVCYEDTPTGKNGQFGIDEKVTYDEGIMIGYRHFDQCKINTKFCFGYGLSYSEYEYKNLDILVREEKYLSVEVAFEVINSSQVDGAEIVQLYVGDEIASVIRPVKELKAFRKIPIKAGESQKISINLDKKAFAFYDVNQKRFRVEPGVFTIFVGTSSQNILLHKKISIIKEYGYL